MRNREREIKGIERELERWKDKNEEIERGREEKK